MEFVIVWAISHLLFYFANYFDEPKILFFSSYAAKYFYLGKLVLKLSYELYLSCLIVLKNIQTKGECVN